jgi:hypothetical protein
MLLKCDFDFNFILCCLGVLYQGVILKSQILVTKRNSRIQSQNIKQNRNTKL